MNSERQNPTRQLALALCKHTERYSCILRSYIKRQLVILFRTTSEIHLLGQKTRVSFKIVDGDGADCTSGVGASRFDDSQRAEGRGTKEALPSSVRGLNAN